ncbi:hypothetical protein DM02DRAFT_49700 [Periconia macrospinosa]|uniref:Uncharacterized protein n=1 Tax=Periconia macrospinosa TaxID=97972 RepID=A0A2V1DJM7_9PLEO|nr:hypothetical protein DM02DRAFT_49700 [Periconia macrospinosa]
MRYDNWDVILFPKDSLVPIQEFRTACYTSEDDNGRTLPTLACYISSQPPSTPFRISVHSWAAPVRPSPLIESRRKPNQRVVITAQVLVDGTRLFHGFYEIGTKWPQEIVNEKRSILEPLQIRRHGPFLDFPPFPLNVLMQNACNIRDNEGKIKILLSEQLIRRTHNPADLELGVSNPIISFAFQHAPRDILEQSGIAWPIHNPLLLPSLQGFDWPPTSRASTTKTRDFAAEPAFAGTRNTDPPGRARADHSQSSQWPKVSEKDSRTNAWDTSMADMYGQNAFGPPNFFRGADGTMQKNNNQVIVTLRDDQFGQIIEAISPPKKQFGNGSVFSSTGLPPKMASFANRPSAAALARKTSYLEPNTKSENKAPHGPTQDPNLPNPYPDTTSIFTSHAYNSRADRKDSDVSMRDPSSVFSTVPVGHRSSPALVPSARDHVQSRKEGLAGVPSTLDLGQIQSLLPEMGHSKSNHEESSEGQCNTAIVADEENGFVPGHKGMSSVDSTVRLERQLFSALGEELSGFNEESLEETRTVSMGDDFGSPITKRKRQGTFGDRGYSPLSKVAKEDKNTPHLRGGV